VTWRGRSADGSWTRQRCASGCTGRRRPARGSAGTRCGWRCRAGPARGWPRRWGATRRRWGPGWPTVAATAPARWPACRQVGPPALNPAQQAALKAAVQRPPREAGLDLADWHGKVVRRFVSERCGVTLSRSSCLNDLHRLGCVVKRPEKRLLKADEAKRAAFVKEDAALRAEADATGAKHLFVDEAHFSSWTRRTSTQTSTCLGRGCSRATRPWWTPPAPARARKPATTPRSAWRRARWKRGR